MSKSQTFQLQNAEQQQRTADKLVVVVVAVSSSSCFSAPSSSTCSSSTSMATKHTFTLFAITFSPSPFRRVLFAKFDAQLEGKGKGGLVAGSGVETREQSAWTGEI